MPKPKHKTDAEREDEYHMPNPYPASPRAQYRAMLFVYACIVILCLMALTKVTNAAPEHALCRAMASTTVSGRYAEWDASIEAWRDMPADLGASPIDLLPVPDDSEWGYTQVYYLMFSPSTMQLWVIPYRSLTPDENGGTHDFCNALIYDLKPENR